MGGKALKIKTKRISPLEYENTQVEIIKIINNTIDFSFIPYIKEKDSFGDIDILVSDNINYRDYIINKFNPNEITHNDNVYSFDYKEKQIDFITTNKENKDYFLNFLSYNGINNLIGRLIKNYNGNLKLKHNGLYYNIKINHYEKSILLTKDFYEILTFFGFDLELWLNGFEKYNDIFDWIYISKLFSSDLFLFNEWSKNKQNAFLEQNMNVKFVEYLKNKENKFYKNNDNNLNYFKDLDQDIIDFENEIAYKELVKSKFNGKLILELFPDLPKENLSSIIIKFKSIFNDDWIIQNNEETIKNEILKIKNGSY